MDYTFKGTPGPWLQSHRKRKDGMYSTEVYDEKKLETIATLSWYAKPKNENGEIGTFRAENAALIAAAPDLLQAALEYVTIIESDMGNPNNNLTSYRKFKIAIKKALNITEP